MSRFNVKEKVKPDTENKAGGQAYSLNPKMELLSLVLTSFLKDKFYESANEQITRMQKLCSEIEDKKFIGKLAIYARTKGNMRSTSHLLAGEIAKNVSGETWTKDLFNKVIVRVDDMSEILGYYFATGKKGKNKKRPAIPNALKKGFGKAFEKFDAYQLAKYKGENKEIKLIDLVNLVHPKSIDKNGTVEVKRIDWCQAKVPSATTHEFSEGETGEDIIKIPTLEALVLGLLKNQNTWEAKQSEAGKKVSEKAKEMKLSTEEKEEMLKEEKADNWKELIETKKIGYMALVKNLRNIVEQAPNLIDDACKLLENEKMILNSKILPFRFTTAIEELNKLNNTKTRKIVNSLNNAIEISVKNVQPFSGSTLIVIDVSGSMQGKPSDIASLFGAVLLKVNPEAELLLFDDSARFKNVNPSDSISTITNQLKYNGGGTDFKCIFKPLTKAYDRMIVLSDMQGWEGYRTPDNEFKAYKNKFACNPYIYSFDLQGYGTGQFNLKDSQVRLISGFSANILELMTKSEIDKNALLDEIESITI